jgi:hypothetical protein
MIPEKDIIVNIRDARKARMCTEGGRNFFNRHGLDWVDFLRNGILASKLLATGDTMALKVVMAAYSLRAEKGDHNG